MGVTEERRLAGEAASLQERVRKPREAEPEVEQEQDHDQQADPSPLPAATNVQRVHLRSIALVLVFQTAWVALLGYGVYVAAVAVF